MRAVCPPTGAPDRLSARLSRSPQPQPRAPVGRGSQASVPKWYMCQNGTFPPRTRAWTPPPVHQGREGASRLDSSPQKARSDPLPSDGLAIGHGAPREVGRECLGRLLALARTVSRTGLARIFRPQVPERGPDAVVAFGSPCPRSAGGCQRGFPCLAIRSSCDPSTPGPVGRFQRAPTDLHVLQLGPPGAGRLPPRRARCRGA